MKFVLRAIVLTFTTSVLLASASAFAGYERVNEDHPDDPMAVKIYRLDNGLTVYLTENHETPRFYAQIAVRAGSMHDPADATGLAHYLEHLLFKGTRRLGTLDFEKEQPHLEEITALYEQHCQETDVEKRKAIYAKINDVSLQAAEYAVPNEMDKLYKEMGGTAVNAHTWHEETVYKVSLPSNRIRHWAVIEAERFTDPVFRLFHTELETVYEEKNRSLDNKSRIIAYAVDDLLYKKHPYGQQPTIGTVEHLKNPSLVTIYEYFNTYYVPNNMGIFISGDIDPEETIGIIDKHFSHLEPGKLPKRKKWKEEPLDGVERVSVNYEGEEYVLMAFRTVGRNHKDAEAFMLLDMILDNATAGLINLNLNQQQRVRAAGSSPAMYNDYGAQYLWGIPKDDQTLEEVEQLLLEQIALLKKGEFEDWIIPAIVTDFKKSQKAQLESDFARVSIMTDSFLALQDWDYTVNQIARMEKVTKKDIVRLANKYFKDDLVVGYRRDAQHDIPSIEKPMIEPIPIDPTRKSAFFETIQAMPYEEIEPVYVDPERDFKIHEDPRGVKFYYAHNPLNDLFTLTFTVEMGAHENNKIRAATQLLDKSGTEEFTTEELQKEWYKLGTNFGIGAGDNETNISISGLDENLEASLKLMMDLLTNPTADQETLDELVKIILVQREDAKKDPGSISSALVNYNRYGEDSVYLRLLPSDEVRRLTVDELHDAIRGLLAYKHKISYVGSRSMDDVIAVIDQYRPLPETLKDPPPYKFQRAREIDETEIYFVDKELAQTQIQIEFPDGEYTEDLASEVQLYNSYFSGGMSGIVFQELREARALAYSAGAHYLQGGRKKAENLMVGGIACQADKTIEAVGAFIDLLDNLPQSPERFAEAQQSILNRYRTSKIGFRQVLGSVRSWELLELEIDPRRKRFQEIGASSLDNVLEFHQERLKARPKLISVVGDKNKIDMEQLAKFGNVVKINVDDIFVD